MLYYIKKTWKNSFLTILCQVISYSIEVFAALASMKMLDGLLAQDTQLFLFGLVAHLGVWAISFLASHMETVFITEHSVKSTSWNEKIWLKCF